MIQATRFRMPAEWDRHDRTLMSWPTANAIWAAALEDARDEYAATARAVARFEPVLMVAKPGDEVGAAKRCGNGVDVVGMPIDDSWMRDSGPIVVRDADGRREGIQFRFNAYGERFVPYDKDAQVAGRVLAHLGMPTRRSELILEGGSITVDGEGTLITTEQCLLNANRNPGWTRAEIEQELCAQFGVEKILWLRFGRLEDIHTDGHVDIVCMFIRPGVVLAQGCDDPTNPNYQRMQSNLKTLRAATDARGRSLQIIELPLLPLVEVCGRPTLVSNTNFYFGNGGLVVPVADAASGDGVLDIFRRACPDREVVGVQARTVGFGGGGIHCITQQIPAVT
jgi:agmatine deiminase